MSTSPKTDSYAWRESARVLKDPMLWRYITAFQSGLPITLYDFFVTHDPFFAAYIDVVWITNGAHRLVGLVVEHGTVHQLEQLAAVKHYDKQRWQETYHTVSLTSLSGKAIQFNRVDMLEWAINNNTGFDKILTVWQTAIKHHQHGEYGVLDLLRVHKPIAAAQLSRLTSRISDVDFVRWFDKHLPHPVDSRHIDHAVSKGNLEIVKYLLGRYPRMNFDKLAFTSASQHGQFDILRYLLENRRARIHRRLVKHMIESGNKQEMQVLADVGGFEDVAREVAMACVLDDQVEKLERLLDVGLLPGGEPFSIDHAAGYNHLDVIKLLVERNVATSSSAAMDRAALAERWDVVMYLHENGGMCTTAVMDAAGAQGRLDELKFFHENRTEGCTTRAMDDAAGEGFLDVVQFLHENRSEGCTTEAMDKAAKNGRLHVVKYLHENRPEGYTTKAMDEAATNGHLRVVEFLHKHRTEGCTVNGIKKALPNGYLAIVRLLFDHDRSLFTADLLHELLLHGAFDIWMKLRANYPEEANAVVESAMLEAGEKLELVTIHFILHELGRDDLAHLAVDGAAKTKLHKQGQWPRAVMAVTGPGSCRLSAIQNAVASADSYNPLTELQFLISVCSESGASELAIAVARNNLDHSLRQELEKGVARGSALQLPPVHPLLLDPRSPSWAVSLALGGFDLVKDPCRRCEQPVPWAIQAIHRGDRLLLEILQDMKHDNRVYAFEGARAAAIRAGNLPLLQWLLTNSNLPVEPTLLDEALYYHQFEIAEWLPVNCLDGCRELNWETKVNVSSLGPCGLDDGTLLQWIGNHADVRDLVDFGGIAYHAVECGNLAALRDLHETHPELYKTRKDLALAARRHDNDSVLEFLREIEYPFLETEAKHVPAQPATTASSCFWSSVA